MAADPPAERLSLNNGRPPKSPKGHFYNARSNSSLGNNSRSSSHLGSGTMNSSVASESTSGVASQGSSSSAQQLAALKQSRKQARRKQLLKGHSHSRGSRHSYRTNKSNDSHDDSNYGEDEENSIVKAGDEATVPSPSTSPSPSPPPPVSTVIRKVPIGTDDDKTYVTHHTYGSLTTMNSAQYSLFSGQHSVFSFEFCDARNWDLRTFNPFIADSNDIHERIRRQMAYTKNGGKGCRLTQLVAAQKAFPGADVDAAMWAGSAPRSFYGTLVAVREQFRSQAVEETSIIRELSLVNKVMGQMPSKDDLERYATVAKKNVLDLIAALEVARNRCGKTLGPVIERLREETEKSCIHSSAWCKENYSNLVELQKQMSDDQENQLSGGSDLRRSKNSLDATESDLVILGRLKYAANSFLEFYGDFLWGFMPSSAANSNKGVTVEASIKFGRDGKRTNKPQSFTPKAEQMNGTGSNVLNSHDTFEATGEYEDSYEPFETTDDVSEDQIGSENGYMNSASKSGSFEHGQQNKVQRDPPIIPIASRVDPDGREAKHADDASVESSECRRKLKNKSTSPVPITKQFLSRDMKKTRKSFPNGKVHDTFERQIMEHASESFQSDAPAIDDKERSRNQLKTGLRRETLSQDTSLGHLQQSSTTGQLGESVSTEVVEKASASVWKKLRKLNGKKKKFAVTRFGEVINEIEREDMNNASSYTYRDDLSLTTNGTQENPIVLMDDDDLDERPLGRNRDAERLSRLDDQSQISALTAPTTFTQTTRYLGRRETTEESQSFAEDYGRQEHELYSFNREGLQAAENVLSSLKTHMSKKPSNTFAVDESCQTFEDYRNLSMPHLGYSSRSNDMPEGMNYNSGQQNEATYAAPEVIQVIDADELEYTETPNLRPQSKLLAHPNRHGLVSNDEPSRVSIPRHKPKLLADPNRHAMIDVNWKPSQQADAPSGGGSLKNSRIEQRDDQQRQSNHDSCNEIDGIRDMANSQLRSDAHYGRSAEWCPPTPEVFRGRKPSSFSSIPSDSDSRSVTSSILGKRIPSRTKTVSWNLPEEEKSHATTGSSRKGSSRGSGSTRSHDESILRAAAARRELAKLSQRQAQQAVRGMSTGQPY